MSCHARQACTMVSTSYSQHLAATFSLSSDQCRAAQSNWGWSQGQERIHRKLSSGKKVNVVVVGGSNTCVALTSPHLPSAHLTSHPIPSHHLTSPLLHLYCKVWNELL